MKRNSLACIAFSAAVGAAWLGSRVRNRYAIPTEKKLARTARPARTVNIAARAVSAFAYPYTYIPIAWSLASTLKRRGVPEGNDVLRSAFIAWASYRALKAVVHRPRPTGPSDKRRDKRSYPSGHATAATAIALSSAYLCLRSDVARPIPVILTAVTAPALIGASRVVLAEHWPTDVVGGWLTGTAVAAGAIFHAT